jgi:hypothetical protein
MYHVLSKNKIQGTLVIIQLMRLGIFYSHQTKSEHLIEDQIKILKRLKEENISYVIAKFKKADSVRINGVNIRLHVHLMTHIVIIIMRENYI